LEILKKGSFSLSQGEEEKIAEKENGFIQLIAEVFSLVSMQTEVVKFEY
jgi:hypothetical protein